MALIERWWGSALASEPPVKYTLARALSDGSITLGQEFIRDRCYVEIYLESCRLESGRKFTSRFRSVVYCFVQMARDGEPVAELAAVTKPDKLADLDPDNLDRVITVSKRLVGPTPWRGGALKIELGLCSVKQSNLMSGVLNLVGKIADNAGMSFVSAAKPFLPLIQEGMDLIAGQTSETAIEVALDTDLRLGSDEILAIVASDQIDKDALTVDPVSRELLESGKPVRASYCVFSIRPVQEKADFGTIPDLKVIYEEFRKHVADNQQTLAENAVNKFRRIALVSPDLINADGERLSDRVRGIYQSAFNLGTQPIGTGNQGILPGSLTDVGLYPGS